MNLRTLPGAVALASLVAAVVVAVWAAARVVEAARAVFPAGL